jgi:stage V sporulation protein B
MKKTSLGHGTIYITISSLVFLITGYLTNIWLGRYLGPASYGIYGVIIALMTAINLTQIAGLPQAVAKFIAEDERKADSVLKSGLILQIGSTLIASMVLLLFAVPLAKLLKDVSLVPYIQASAAIFPLYGVYALYLNFYNGLHFFKIQAMMNIIYSVAKLVSIVGLVYFFHVYGAILGFIISPFVALLFWIRIPKNKQPQFPYKRIILFSLPLIGVAVFLNLLQSMDLLFVKALLHSNKDTGFYTASQNISRLPFYGVIALGSVLFPSISRTVSQKLEEETRSIIGKSLRFSFLILLPSTLLVSATSLSIINLLYSSAYNPGAGALSILVIGSGFFTLFSILTTIMSSSGSPNTAFVFSVLGVVITSILCLVLIPLFGIKGAAFSTSIGSLLITIIAFFWVYKKFKIFLAKKSLLKIIFASVIIAFLSKTINFPLLFLPVFYLLLAVGYIGLLVLMKEITREDVKMALSLLPARIVNKFKITEKK